MRVTTVAWAVVCELLSSAPWARATKLSGASSMWGWSRVDVGGMRPAGREGHASVEVGNRIYVIGGCVQEIRCYNDVHIFDTDQLTWTQEPFTGDLPEPRGGHTATLVGTDVFVFGGASSEATYGDVYKLDLIKRHWTRAVSTTGGAAGGRRTNHAAAADAHGRIYIFGGYNADGDFLNDMWILSVYAPTSVTGIWTDAGSFPVLWEKPMPTGPVPLQRESHTLNIVDRKLIAFGGYTVNGRAANDVHVYDLDTQNWAELPVTGDRPAPRQAHSAARHGRDIVVTGGCDVSQANPVCYSDVWSLSLVDMRWSQRSTDVVTWFAREGHSANFVRGRMFTFGGCQLSNECYNDVNSLDTLDPCPASCSGHGECRNEEFCSCQLGFTSHDCMQPLTCPQDCSGHGSCSNTGQCSCDNGYSGSDCSVDIPCPGGLNKCSTHGKCEVGGHCACFMGYTGEDCAEGEAACPADCNGNGVCSPSSQCKCHAGWSGESCNQKLALLEEKCPHNCCGHGKCEQGVGCHCKAGWFGATCAASGPSWQAASQGRNAGREQFLQEARGKREQANKSRFLVEVMQRSASQRGTATTPSVIAQVQQLDMDVRRLLAAGDEAERNAEKLSRPPSFSEELALLGTAAVCPLAKWGGNSMRITDSTPGFSIASSATTVVTDQAPAFQALPQAGVGASVYPDAPTPPKKNISMALVSGSLSKASPMRGVKAKPPVNADFGVDSVNEPGSTGVQDSGCPENCNFRGVCEASADDDGHGTCYCQPGYYGTTCDSRTDEQTHTMSLGMVLAIAVGCVLMSFSFTICLLSWNANKKRQAETKLGYNV